MTARAVSARAWCAARPRSALCCVPARALGDGHQAVAADRLPPRRLRHARCICSARCSPMKPSGDTSTLTLRPLFSLTPRAAAARQPVRPALPALRVALGHRAYGAPRCSASSAITASRPARRPVGQALHGVSVRLLPYSRAAAGRSRCCPSMPTCTTSSVTQRVQMIAFPLYLRLQERAGRTHLAAVSVRLLGRRHARPAAGASFRFTAGIRKARPTASPTSCGRSTFRRSGTSLGRSASAA